MKYGKFLIPLFFISVLCMCACLDNNNNSKILQNNTNNAIKYNNENGNITIENNNLNKNNDLNLNNTNSNVSLNMAQNHINYSIDYEIIEYGKFGEKNYRSFYNYVDESENKTIIVIFAGKRPVDCDIKIIKIVKNSNSSITVYINETIHNNSMIITSPYIILKVNGIFKNVKFIED